MTAKLTLIAYAVRIDYASGMERVDLTAKDRIDLLTHLAKILRIKRRCGINKKLVGVTIERE